MAQNSYFLVSLGILNLVLVMSGLLLTYFDWSMARRREYLYLYFAEDKPGASYFAAARRRRAQYTRLLVAFLVLFCAEFFLVSLIMMSGVQDSAGDVTQLKRWLECLRTLSLALLGMGFLYREKVNGKPCLDVWVAAVVAIWSFFVLAMVSGVFEPDTDRIVLASTVVARLVLSLCFAVMAWRRGGEVVAQGLLQTRRLPLAAAFLLWGVGPFVHFLVAADDNSLLTLGQMMTAVSLAILVNMTARGVLQEYETVEGSRHRLGRERQVILSFLKRIGAAFTTAVEVDEVLRIILESALETTEASAGAIYLYHGETGLLEPRVVLHFFPPLHVDTPAALSAHRTEELEAEMKLQKFRLGEGVIGSVAQEGRARLIDDVRAEKIMLGTTTDFMRNRSMLIVPLKIRDEPLGVMTVLNKQRGSFQEADQFLLQALADQGALSINNAMLTLEVGKQERLRRELQIARDIQRMLLPEKCPTVPGFELSAHGSSAYEVGGDYYDFFYVDDDRLGIVVADVSGKGVPAALTVAMMRSVFRTQSRGNSDVRDVLSQVNKFMVQDLRSRDFITCVYGILEISTRKFSWARAGHEPVILAHETAPTDILRPEGFALGVIESPEFDDLLEVETMQFKSGDRLLIFTDGLTEAMNSEGEEFGMERILDVMNHDGSGSASSTFPHRGAQNGASPTNGADMSTHEALIDDAESQARAAQELNRRREMFGNPETARNLPFDPLLSSDDADDLKSIEIAVQGHVGNEPQSDDLTIVYLTAK